MKVAAFVLIVWTGAVVAFAASGYAASLLYELYGCIWTSSTVFGVSFLALASSIGGIVTHLFDLTDWFN